MQNDTFLRTLFSKAHSHDVLIIVNRGGWGYGGIAYEREARHIIMGIEKFLTKWGWRCKAIPYKRLKSRGFFTKLGAIFSASFAYSINSKYLAKAIKELRTKMPHAKVLLVGYSMGGAINNKVMKLLGRYTGVYSIQLGAPFNIKSPKNSHVLDIRNSLDMFANGTVISFIPAASVSFAFGVIRMLLLKELNPEKAVKIFGHKYKWKDVKIRRRIETFLKRHFSKKN